MYGDFASSGSEYHTGNTYDITDIPLLVLFKILFADVVDSDVALDSSLAVKNVDESYNEYKFIIQTDVEPWSEYLEKQAAKQAKRDAKGKKKQNVEDLM